MARLVVRAGPSGAQELRLKPGLNSLGRSPSNDFQIPDGSVSSTHCQLIVDGDSAVIQDLGSTNGTFLNGTPVKDAVVQSGQTLHLGDVEMVFYADAVQAVATTNAPLAVPSAKGTPVAAAVSPAGPVSLMGMPPPTPSPAPSGSSVPVPLSRPPLAVAGAHYCRFHPKTNARYLCQRCQHFFCEACVALRHVGGVPIKFCRHCGAECTPVQVQLEANVEKGFWARIPGAFVYPLRGVGIFAVLVGVVLFALLKGGQVLIRYGTLRMIGFGVIALIFAGGYLFTYLQCILHSTAAEERELPDLPGIGNFFEDVFVPFLRLLGLALCCFAPAITLAIWFGSTHEPTIRLAAFATLIMGGLYFPMAFLAVAILDSVAAGNPLVVVPSIARVPLEYFFTFIFLSAVFALRWLGDFLFNKAFPDSWTTDSMRTLFAMLGAMAFTSFLTLYLLVVGIHILGLVYVAKKNQLGWLRRKG